jgi:hypothetical protein
MILPGNTVLMADGSQKPVEQIAIGDSVQDWLGNVSTVEGIIAQQLDIARVCVQINGTLTVTQDQMFLGTDRSFTAAINPNRYWAVRQNYVGINNQIMMGYNWGSNPDSVELMNEGTTVCAYKNTSVAISGITAIPAPANTVVYSHRVSNSGTLVVGGIATSAWPKIWWDYKNWEALPSANTYAIVRNTSTNLIQVIPNFDPSSITYPYQIWSNDSMRFINPTTASPTGSTGASGGIQIIA